jgi:hypothetical protein
MRKRELRVCLITESIAPGTHIETNAKMTQNAMKFNLEMNQLEQIREGTPVHIHIQDKHGGYFVRPH